MDDTVVNTEVEDAVLIIGGVVLIEVERLDVVRALLVFDVVPAGVEVNVVDVVVSSVDVVEAMLVKEDVVKGVVVVEVVVVVVVEVVVEGVVVERLVVKEVATEEVVIVLEEVVYSFATEVLGEAENG